MRPDEFIEKLKELTEKLTEVIKRNQELNGILQFGYHNLPCVPVIFYHVDAKQLQVNLPIDSTDQKHLHLCLDTGFPLPPLKMETEIIDEIAKNEDNL